MKKRRMKLQTEITVKGIEGFIKKRVTPFGNGAKVDCPKKFIGRGVYLIICRD